MPDPITQQRTVVGLGELLWDLLPSGKQLGGAPANFAYISSLFGNRGVVASRVGTDSHGDAAVEKLSTLGLEDAFVQRDPSHPTGTVGIEIDDHGQPTFTIFEDVAWDHIEWTPDWEKLAAQADAVCFGSLAQRSPDSRSTILRFLKSTRNDALRIFDVNLRQGYFSREVLIESLALADVVKLNDAELPTVLSTCGLPVRNELENARVLRQEFNLDLVCVTRGVHGSLLVSETENNAHPGYQVTVSDTIGAGDAFTAALAYHFAQGESLATINRIANRVGSWIASVPGAMPRISREEFQRQFMTSGGVGQAS
jgi:fructokinase